MSGEVEDPEIARWRFRFFGLLLFGVLFLAASTVAFFLALSADLHQQWTVEEIEHEAENYARQIFAMTDGRVPHYSLSEKHIFTDIIRIRRERFPEVPDELYPFFVEKVWDSYQRMRRSPPDL